MPVSVWPEMARPEPVGGGVGVGAGWELVPPQPVRRVAARRLRGRRGEAGWDTVWGIGSG